MIIAQVIGNLVSTHKEKNLNNEKLLIVKDIYNTKNQSLIVLDAFGAGLGEYVLVSNDGGAARQVTGKKDAPINAVIIGIIDYPELYKIF